jgi:HEAT repeat protein/energy-coupling factor transporter ATP-binding protein EcfA2
MTPSERLKLFDDLSELDSQDFDRLLVELNPPKKNIPGPAAPPGSRVKALLDWAESPVGCGFEQVLSLFDQVMQNKTEDTWMSDYLSFVCADPRYQEVRELYTETEALLNLEAKTSSQNGEERTFKVVEELYRFVLGQSNEIEIKELYQDKEKSQIRHVVLSGRPGSGKSTTLKCLSLMLADAGLSDRTQAVPVFVELKGDKSIFEHIEAEFYRAKVRIDLQQIKNWLFEDRLILLLDGWNEIPSSDRRNALQTFRGENLSTPIIFTTRDLAIGGDLPEIKHRLEMRSLDNSQMQDFVEKYLASKGMHDQASRLLGQLKDRLKEVAETPLLLKMLCDVFEETRRIPQSKGELFRLFDAKFDELKTDIPISDDFRRFKSEMLRHLAFCMTQGDVAKPTEARLTLERTTAERIVENWLAGRVEAPGQKAKEWLEDLLEHHLLQLAASPKEIEFHHQLFQEYYAAEEILAKLRDGNRDLSEDKRLQYFFLNYLKWTETISLMMSLLDEKDVEIMVRITRLALDVDLFLGAKLAGSAKPIFQKDTVGLLLSPKVNRYVRIGFFKFPLRLSTPDWLKIKLWNKAKSSTLKDKWLKLINSENVYDRWYAACGLRYCEPQGVISAFHKALDDEDEDIRLVAVSSLAYINSEVVLPCLIKATKDEKASIRNEAVKAIGELRTKKAIPVFHDMIEDESSSVRFNLVKGLSKLDSKTAVSELTPLIRERCLYPAITYFLGEIGTEEAFLVLLKALDHEETTVRKYVVEEIGKFDPDSAIPPLNSVLKYDQDHEVRERAVHVLETIDSDQVVSMLIEALDDDHCSVYLAAAVALENIEPKISFSRIQQALGDHDSFIRCKAIMALGKLGNKSSHILHEMLKDENSSVRFNAALELLSLGSLPEVVSVLEDADDDTLSSLSDWPDVRSNLNQLRIENIISDLRKIVEKQNIDSSSWLIGSYLAEKIPELLFLVDAEESLREDAKYLLAKVTANDAVPGFLKALESPDENVRFRAQNVLKKKDISEILVVVERIYFRRKDYTKILRYLTEIFSTDFYNFFLNKDTSPILWLTDDKDAEYFDITRPIFPAYSGEKVYLTSALIKILRKASKRRDVDLLLRIIQVCSTVTPEQSVPILLKLLNSKYAIVREAAEEQLEFLGCEHFLPELLKMISYGNGDRRNWAIGLLGQHQGREAATAMPLLISQLHSTSGPAASNALRAIQSSCQIYNYVIAQLHLEPLSDQSIGTSNSIFNIQQVGNFNAGPVTIQGNQKGFG